MASTRSDLIVVTARVEAVLVRLLGAVVRRGFEPVRVSAVEGATPGTFDVRLTVEGVRPIEALVRHLANLYDVRRVEASAGSGDAAGRP